MYNQVRVLSVANERDDVAYELAVAFVAFLSRSVFRVLLKAPDGPQQGIGLLHFIDLDVYGLLVNVLVDSLFCRGHILIEAFFLAD